jgi:3-oxoacyl-[acyl-carrier-protein] synthase-3
VDYHEAVSLAASDGAGAAVVGRSHERHHFRLIDWANVTDTQWYGAFHLSPRPQSSGQHKHFSKALMTIDGTTGGEAFKAFGLQVPGPMVTDLLARHGLRGQDITLVAHQSSKLVCDAWRQAIAPFHYISTLEEFGDMVSSSVPVNLSKCFEQIRTRHLVLLGIGMEMHATALLYVRD